MTINWPEDRGQQVPRRKPRAAAWGQGEVRLSDDDLWGAGTQPRLSQRQVQGLVALIALLLVIGLAIWLYGPLPQLLPRECTGCFVPQP